VIAVAGLSGSLRAGSLNARLLAAARTLAPKGCSVEALSIRGVPLYDGDVEAAEGLPAAVVALKERIIAADALLLVTPEYNNSLPGVLKNTVDWLSRPPADIERVFGNRPVGLIGATPGMGGTRLAQSAWLPVLRTLGTRPWFGRQLYVTGAHKLFGEAGELIDEATRERLGTYMREFAAFVAACKA
jgi:NAD(P)H-dependent FMN reductase